MRNDRVLTVAHGRIVTALIEHTHVDAENIGDINRASHAALIRADGHKVICINLKILVITKDIFDKLIGRCHRLEP